MSTNQSVSFNDELIALLKARTQKSGRPFSTLVNELLWQAIKQDEPKAIVAEPTEKPAAIDKDVLTWKKLRDGLRKCSKVSPIKTELIEILSAIIKDEPTKQSVPTLKQTLADMQIEDDEILDDFLEQRKQRQTQQSLSSLASTDVFRPGGALERAMKRGNPEHEGLRKYVPGQTEENRETPRRTEADKNYQQPEEDWFPEDEE